MTTPSLNNVKNDVTRGNAGNDVTVLEMRATFKIDLN